MRKHAYSAVIAAAIGCTALGLTACQQKQSAGQKMKQGAQEMGQGVKQGASETGQFLSDSAITTKVKSKLAANQGLSSFGIHVETNNGVVTLTGSVDKDSERSLATQVARDTDGVKGVNNNITVKNGG